MMKRLCTALALALLAGCIPAFAQDLNVRQFDRTVDPRNVTTTDKLTWYAGESIEYIVRSRRGREVVDVPAGSTPVWTVLQGTNGYLIVEGEVVTNGVVRFWVPADLTALPEGEYTSWASAYQGTNRVGVLDRATVEVRWRPGDSYTAAAPMTNVLDQVLAWWADANANLAATSNHLAQAIIDAVAAETAAREAAGYLTSYTETDPIYAASDAYAITAAAIANWDTAYGWGNHGAAGYISEEADPSFSSWLDSDPLDGYLTSYTETDPLWTAASGSVVSVTTVAYTAAVEQAATAFGWGDHSGAGYLDSTATTSDLPNIAWGELGGGSSFALNGITTPVTLHGRTNVDLTVAGTDFYLDVPATPVAEESDPLWSAASGSVIYATTPTYTTAVEQAATAYGWGDHAEAGYLTSLWTNNVDANDMEIDNLNTLGVFTITVPVGFNGEFLGAWNFVTDEPTVKGSRVLRHSTLAPARFFETDGDPTLDHGANLPHTLAVANDLVTYTNRHGHTRMVITTTNDYQRSSGYIEIFGGTNLLDSYNPGCDGSAYTSDYPWVEGGMTITLSLSELPAAPGVTSAPPVITALDVYNMADTGLVSRAMIDTQNQVIGGDYPSSGRQWANKDYADDVADAALAAANAETHYRTAPTDFQGQPVRLNPRFDTVAAGNSLSTLYGGSTALRLDGEGAAIVPEIRAFAVEAGDVATLTVWSYSGGASNLVPEVTTNLITGAWEQKPESIVSATNIDAFTAQVVFTNDFERLLYVRLVDVSGGSGVPVLRVFGGIAFGDGEAITDWPDGYTGTGWTTLAFSGSGNALTGATATATTLTLQRGTIEGGGGTATVGAEGEPLTYAWSTNITLLAGTNRYNQRILSIDGPTTITPPTKASASNDYLIKVTIPSAGTNSVLFATNSPPVVGYVPSASTSAYWVVTIGSDAGSSNVWMRRTR